MNNSNYATILLMSPEVIQKESLGQRELMLGYITTWYEQSLLTGLWNRYADQTFNNGRKRNWLVCGPASNTLSRIINWKSGIPILANGNLYTQEHLRTGRSYFYNPPKGEVQDKGVDHEFLSYFNGKGHVIHIDPAWRLIWGDKKHLTGNNDLAGAIIIEKYPVSEYETVLRNKYHLYPYDPESEAVQKAFAHYGVTPPSLDETENYLNVSNSDQLTSPMPFNRPSKDLYSRTGTPLADFIRTIIPEWAGIR